MNKADHELQDQVRERTCDHDRSGVWRGMYLDVVCPISGLAVRDSHTIRHGLWRMHTQCRRCLRMTNGTVLFTTMILFDPAAVAWCIDYMHTTDVAPLLVHDYC